MPENIKCKHCGEKRPAIGFAPFPNELGQRIARRSVSPAGLPGCRNRRR